MTARRRLLWIGVAVFVALVSAAGVIVYQWQIPHVRERLVQILSDRLDSDVDLADLDVTLGWTVHVTGERLVLHHKRHTDLPPLVRIDRFAIDVPMTSILHTPIHVSSVELTGLEIHIPPKGDRDAPGTDLQSKLGGPSPVVVDELTTEGALLDIASSKPGREPKRFELHHLRLTDAAFDRPTNYQTELTNPIPKGTIVARGTFGPWEADDPSLTPLTGVYTFAHADLGTIKGIGGTLESEGHFSGRLAQINVQGSTRTPDFTLDIGGTPLPLTTDFSAIVDGTNGDTLLTMVHAVLGQSKLTAKGGIVHVEGQKGRTVQLDATIAGGHLEDVLHLATDDDPPAMSGALNLKTRIDLPPGEADVPIRLRLDGSFDVASARFSSDKVQRKIDELSRRGRGKPEDAGVRNVASNLKGQFRLGGGLLRLSKVSFAVRGATIRLGGTYSLPRQTLNFAGTARMDAKASQMVTGWKRFPLKILDPFLSKDGAGTVLPIKVTGPVKHPDFKVEVSKIF